MINQLIRGPANVTQNTGCFTATKAGANFPEPRHFVLRSDALYTAAIRLPGGGLMNAHVFWAESSTPENPIMRVKGTDVDGTSFDVEVRINDLNKRSLSFVEMFALDGYLRANGETCGVARAAGAALGGSSMEANAFSRFDVLPAMQSILALQQSHGNFDGVAWWSSIIDSFLSHFAGR